MKKALLTSRLQLPSVLCTAAASIFFTLNSGAQPSALGKLYSDYSTISNGSQIRYSINPMGAGHLMGGVGDFYINTSTYWPMVIRTDLNGDVVPGGGTFNKTYHFFHPLTPTSGSRAQVTSNEALELQDGTGYMSAFAYYADDPLAPGGVQRGVVMMELDLYGGLVNYHALAFDPTSIIPTDAIVTGITQVNSNAPNEFLITGRVFSGEEKQIFVIRIDRNGNTAWTQLYDFNTGITNTEEMPNDLIINGSEIYVVGDIHLPGQPHVTHDGFILTLDLNNGSVVKSELVDAGGWDGFRNIALSYDPASPGFVLCGYSNATGGNQYSIGQVWVVKTDMNCNIMWSRTYDDANDPQNLQFGNDIIGEADRRGNYFYQVAGGRNAGSNDVIKLKIDANGVPQNPGAMQISDLGPTNHEYAVNIDNTQWMGSTLYGQHVDWSTSSAASECYLLYNCFSDAHDVIENRAQKVTQQVNIIEKPAMVPFVIRAGAAADNTDKLICFQARIATGIAEVSGSEAGMNVYPNPTSGNLSINIGSVKNAEVSILNVQGELINTATADSPVYTYDASGLPSGLYFVEIKGENSHTISKFIKQ